MRMAMQNKIYKHSFWLVLLLHILILLCISTKIVFWSEENENPYVPKRVPRYVPSYFYTGTVNPVSASAQQKSSTTPIEKTVDQSKLGINKSQAAKQPSILTMSRNAIRADFINAALSSSKAEEPILLVGDDSETADPLIKLLGKSLSAHFNYPRMEGTFGIRGRVYIRLTLHPEGYYSDIQIVKPSENENFNRAALYAVNSAPRVVGINQLLKTPKRFLIGFIFE